MTKLSGFLVCLLLASPSRAAATGRVVGPDGAPIAGASICEYLEGSPEHCVTADAQGVYRMENPLRATLLVRATGYVSKTIDAAPLNGPVELQRAATLLVVVVDEASGQPLSKGRVMIDSPSGKRIGDSVPFNKAGVRITTLDPGMVFVRVECDGYQASGPVPVELISGTERTARVALKKSTKTAH
jgi:hypothetical protein